VTTEPHRPLDDDTTAGDRGHPSNRGRGWLTPNVKTLSGVSFLQDAASEMLYPVLPIFHHAGAPVAVVGIVEGVRGDPRARRAIGGPQQHAGPLHLAVRCRS